MHRITWVDGTNRVFWDYHSTGARLHVLEGHGEQHQKQHELIVRERAVPVDVKVVQEGHCLLAQPLQQQPNRVSEAAYYLDIPTCCSGLLHTRRLFPYNRKVQAAHPREHALVWI